MPPKKKAKKVTALTMPPKKKAKTTNVDDLYDIFVRLSEAYEKQGDERRSKAFQTTSEAMKNLKEITCGKDIAKFKGVGKSSVEVANEFLKSGKCARLEELEEAGKEERWRAVIKIMPPLRLYFLNSYKEYGECCWELSFDEEDDEYPYWEGIKFKIDKGYRYNITVGDSRDRIIDVAELLGESDDDERIAH